jgi:hypothetical protein
MKSLDTLFFQTERLLASLCISFLDAALLNNTLPLEMTSRSVRIKKCDVNKLHVSSETYTGCDTTVH